MAIGRLVLLTLVACAMLEMTVAGMLITTTLLGLYVFTRRSS